MLNGEKHYLNEGIKRYKKGQKSTVKYLQKALELAQNSSNPQNELLNNIFICGYFAIMTNFFLIIQKPLFILIN